MAGKDGIDFKMEKQDIKVIQKEVKVGECKDFKIPLPPHNQVIRGCKISEDVIEATQIKIDKKTKEETALSKYRYEKNKGIKKLEV